MIGFLGKVISTLISLVVVVVLLIGGCVFVLGTAVKEAKKGGALDAIADSAEKSFAKGVADDLIEQYDIVKNGTDEMAKAARAGAVAEMYLQARDQASYSQWKAKSDGHMQKALGR